MKPLKQAKVYFGHMHTAVRLTIAFMPHESEVIIIFYNVLQTFFNYSHYSDLEGE